MSVGVLAQEEIKPGGTRIVGGETTTIEEHPWQVAIEIKHSDGTYLCGGSIILKKWVLSAAHCFSPDAQPNEVKVKAGATDYVSEGKWSPVDKVVVHERYNPQTFENDIALIKIDPGLPKGQIISLVDAASTLTPGQPLQVTGWGTTKEVGGQMPTHLLKATVPYVDNDTCNKPDSYNGSSSSGDDVCRKRTRWRQLLSGRQRRTLGRATCNSPRCWDCGPCRRCLSRRGLRQTTEIWGLYQSERLSPLDREGGDEQLICRLPRERWNIDVCLKKVLQVARLPH